MCTAVAHLCGGSALSHLDRLRVKVVGIHLRPDALLQHGFLGVQQAVVHIHVTQPTLLLLVKRLCSKQIRAGFSTAVEVELWKKNVESIPECPLDSYTMFEIIASRTHLIPALHGI